MSDDPIIIYAEDDDAVFNIVQKYFGWEGYTVVRARDGEEVVEMTRVNENKIAAILMDLRMPKKSGLDAVIDIRKFSDVPIIITTAFGNEQINAQCMAAGCQGYLTKPCSGVELLTAVQNNMRRRTE